MSFNRKACKQLLASMASQDPDGWLTMDRMLEGVKNTEGIVSADWEESHRDKALKQELRETMNEEDPETGLPIGASLLGDDGERRYKQTRLFDASDYRKMVQVHYGRAVHHARMIRRYEQRGGLEQMSLDLRWLDSEGENAAA